MIADSDNKFDGLIYVLSCNGGRNNVIYDSTGDEVKLQHILEQFSNKNCAKLRKNQKLLY